MTVLFAPFHLAVAALTWDAVEGPGLVTLRIAGGVSTLGAAVSILYWASASLDSGAPRRGADMVGAGLGVIGGVLTVLVTVLSVAGSGPIPGELVTAVVFAFAGVAARASQLGGSLATEVEPRPLAVACRGRRARTRRQEGAVMERSVWIGSCPS